MEGKITWWKDSDGIDPGKAGCHIGTDSQGKPKGMTNDSTASDSDLA
ncbi:MAG: hypothetical protein WBO73_14120 [Gammaproteobacteria bacterium]